ncbi:MAG: hypothetical protein E7Z91_01625 [Cyanobacteria bacterium SIG30]|nr:hypothetical protein [Cyanobacteria bacterium SIG30]
MAFTLNIEKEPILAFIPIFLANFVQNLPFVEDEFKIVYPIKNCGCDFYTFVYKSHFYGHTFTGIIEIKCNDDFEIKIIQKEKIYEIIKYYPENLQKIALTHIFYEIFLCCVKNILKRKKIKLNEFEKEDIIETCNYPDCIDNQNEGEIFQIIVFYYLKYNNPIFTLKPKDIFIYKKISKNDFVKNILKLEEKGLIVLLNKTEDEFLKEEFDVLLPYFEAISYKLPSKIFELNSKHKMWQKKIANFIYFNDKKFVKVKDLLNLVKEQFNVLKPSQIRLRLEDVLDDLRELKIIEDWEYRYIKEENLMNKNWFEKYKNLSVKFSLLRVL